MIIRQAHERDVDILLGLVKQLAVYEKLAEQAVATKESFLKYGFSERPYFEALIAEEKQDDKMKAVGFALYFFTFSTFVGKPSLYLEDIFVLPEYRKNGIGRALLHKLVEIARLNDCGRMEWSVLDWNEPAIQFYRSLGAKSMSDWTVYRLDEPAQVALLHKKHNR
jgi:GNAT superfamily N-acetyltransferase